MGADGNRDYVRFSLCYCPYAWFCAGSLLPLFQDKFQGFYVSRNKGLEGFSLNIEEYKSLLLLDIITFLAIYYNSEKLTKKHLEKTSIFTSCIND